MRAVVPGPAFFAVFGYFPIGIAHGNCHTNLLAATQVSELWWQNFSLANKKGSRQMPRFLSFLPYLHLSRGFLFRSSGRFCSCPAGRQRQQELEKVHEKERKNVWEGRSERDIKSHKIESQNGRVFAYESSEAVFSFLHFSRKEVSSVLPCFFFSSLSLCIHFLRQHRRAILRFYLLSESFGAKEGAQKEWVH